MSETELRIPLRLCSYAGIRKILAGKGCEHADAFYDINVAGIKLQNDLWIMIGELNRQTFPQRRMCSQRKYAHPAASRQPLPQYFQEQAGCRRAR